MMQKARIAAVGFCMVALAVSAASAEVFGNGSFDPGTTHAGRVSPITVAQADANWVGQVPSNRVFTKGNYDANGYIWATAPDQGSTTVGSMYNLAYDGKATTGEMQLTVDVFVYDDGPEDANSFVANSTEVFVNLWGYNGSDSEVNGKLEEIGDPWLRSVNPGEGGGADAILIDNQPLSPVAALDAWETQTFDIDLGAGYEYLMVTFGAGANDAYGVAIDNVDIVPEPATLSLLGLGGLMAVARRRRG